MNIEELNLAPNESAYVPTYTQINLCDQGDLIISDNVQEDEENDNDTFKIYPSVAKISQNGEYHVLIKNESNEHLCFDTNTPIAKIEPIAKQTKFQNFQTLEGEPLPSNYLSMEEEHILN